MDRLEQDLQGAARVLRLDVRSEVGRTVAITEGARYVPAFILYAQGGEVIYREFGRLDAARVRELLR